MFRIIILAVSVILSSASFSRECHSMKEGKDAVECLEEKIAELNRKLEESKENQIPRNSVVAFNQSSCPDGWEDFVLAYGRFVRGIDKSKPGRDPEGKRAPGEVQEDMFENHTHQIAGAKSAGHNPQEGHPHGYKEGQYGYKIHATREANSGSYGSETRPKNVALLYCIKN